MTQTPLEALDFIAENCDCHTSELNQALVNHLQTLRQALTASAEPVGDERRRIRNQRKELALQNRQIKTLQTEMARLAASPQTPSPAPNREAVARAICLVQGYDPDDIDTQQSIRTVDKDGQRLPMWESFTEEADAVLALFSTPDPDTVTVRREDLRRYMNGRPHLGSSVRDAVNIRRYELAKDRLSQALQVKP